MDVNEILDAQRQSLKLVGVSQAYLSVKDKFEKTSVRYRDLKKTLQSTEALKVKAEEERDMAVASAGKAYEELQSSEALKVKAEEERDVAVASAGKAHEELHLKTDALEKVSSELAALQESSAKSFDMVKSLQAQRTELWSEVEKLKAARAEAEFAHKDCDKILSGAAADCFKSALAQLRYLNPGLDLNTDGYHPLAFVKGGEYYPPPPSDDESSSFSEEMSEAGGDEARTKETDGGEGKAGTSEAGPSAP